MKFRALQIGDRSDAPVSPPCPLKANKVFKSLAEHIDTARLSRLRGDCGECDGTEECNDSKECDGGEDDAWRW